MEHLKLRTWNLENKQKISSVEELEELLLARQEIPKEAEEAYFNPKFEDLADPFSFKDMALAVELILHVYQINGRVLIYGDYDCDGISATALLVHFFRAIGLETEYQLPSRISTGYGLNLEVAEEILKNPPDLVITVDNGSSAREAVETLMQAHIPVIVTDHHKVTEDRAYPMAFINPNWEEENFYFPYLSGVGVAFYLLMGLAQKLKLDLNYKPFLALVALGTVADYMPLEKENRTLVSLGLKALAEESFPGLQTLFKSLKPEGEADSEFIAFSLASRINAAGRMDDAEAALHLLLASEEQEIFSRLQDLEDMNNTRKALEAKVYAEAMEQIKSQPAEDKENIIVVADETWHPGIIGIISARISDEFNLPSICFGGSQGELRGSARSSGNFNLFAAIEDASEFCDNWGGHKEAAGMTIQVDMLPAFSECVRKYAAKHSEEFEQDLGMAVLAELDHALLSEESLATLNKFEPFGAANPKPFFLFKDLSLESIRRIGDGSHLSLNFRSTEQREVRAIAFRQGGFADIFRAGDRVDVVAELNLHSWNGRSFLQMQVKDMHPSRGVLENYHKILLIWQSWQEGKSVRDLPADYQLEARKILAAESPLAKFWMYLADLLKEKSPLSFYLPLLALDFAIKYSEPISCFGIALMLQILAEAELIRLTFKRKGRALISATQPSGRPRLSDQPSWQRIEKEIV